MPDKKRPLPPRTQLRHYWIKSVFSITDGAIVYIAEDMRLDEQLFLVEFFPQALATRPEGDEVLRIGPDQQKDYLSAQDSFMLKADELSRSTHPNLLAAKNHFHDNGTAYIVCDYHDTLPLRSYLEIHGRELNKSDISRLMAPVIAALTALHHKNILHLGIHPDTLLVRKNGTGMLLGLPLTPPLQESPYTPPELCAQIPSQPDITTDIYAVAALLYELITSTPPAAAIKRDAAIKKEKADPYIPLEVSAEYPAELCTAINTALALESSLRPQSLGSLQAHFQNRPELQTSDSAVDMPKAGKAERSRRNSYLRMAIMAAAATLFLYTYQTPVQDINSVSKLTLTQLHIAGYFGDTEAQRMLGDIYSDPNNGKLDMPLAVEWYSRAAKYGNLDAQTRLGMFYYQGRGVPQSYSEAFTWFGRAAHAGNPIAQFYVGEFYYRGYGVEKNFRNALQWYGKSAEQGVAEAVKQLADMHFYGEGTAKDMGKAMALYKKRNSMGESRYTSSMLGYINAAKVTKESSQLEALKHFEKLAAQGDTYAQFSLGLLYMRDEEIPKDYQKAMQWFLKAAEKGHTAAQSHIALIYLEGLGVEQDYKQTYEWSMRSAKLNAPSGYAMLGYLYEMGYGVEKDYTQAHEWYLKAAAQGESSSQSNLGVMYYYGNGVKRDYATAKAWFMKAADNNDKYAQNYLGEMYLKGQGSAVDRHKAAAWFTKAAQQNLARAQYNLGKVYQEGLAGGKGPAAGLELINLAARQGYAPAVRYLETPR